MARQARITHIQTGAERDAGSASQPYSEESAKDRADRAADRARFDQQAKDRGDKTYGPGRPDGMGPKKWYQRG